MMNFGLSSSSQSSSSSSHYNKTSTTTATIATLVPSSLFNHHGADTKLELMDSSPRQNNEDDVGCRGEDNNPIIAVEKEHMFDKVVTPSDVGKLNRLVIPKQHAEKYFPLDSTSNEKGLLLNFEDRNGKPWRFRYSYWNSSQSYVMTKGWSRFVKEKKLDAGDIVSFQRGLGELGKDRLFIDWRRRPDAPDPSHHHHGHHPLQFHQHYPPNFAIPHQHQQQHFSWNHHQHHRSVPWSPLLMRPPGGPMAPRDHMSSPQMNYGVNLHHHPYRSSGTSSITGGGGSSGGGGSAYGYGNVVSSSGPIYYLRSASSASSGPQQFPEQEGSGLQHQLMLQQQREVEMGRAHEANMVLESVPVVHGKAAAAAKRLRLFGVNMECPVSDQSDECDILSSISSSSSPSSSHYHPHHHHQYHAPSTTTTTTMPLQLRLYDGTPHHPETTAAATTTDFLSGGKAASPSSMSLDFDV